MASLSQALRLGDLPPPHRTFQGHATHIIEWSMMLRPNDSWSTCIPQGIATFLHYASRRSAGLRYTTVLRSARASPIATTAWLVAPRALPPPSTRVSAERVQPAAARHRVPGACPVSGVLGHGAASSTCRARVPSSFFRECPIVLVDGFQHVLENESQEFYPTLTGQSSTRCSAGVPQ